MLIAPPTEDEGLIPLLGLNCSCPVTMPPVKLNFLSSSILDSAFK